MPLSSHPLLASSLALTATLALFLPTLRAADTRCYEMRIYTANTGKLDDLHARFRNHTLRLFERHGMTNIGYWVPVENPGQKLYYILAYPGLAAREDAWKGFQADPEWQQAKAASEQAGALVGKVETHFLEATDFSPEIKPAHAPERRLFELRTYTAAPGHYEQLVQRGRDNTEWLFNTYHITGIGYWTVQPNQSDAGKFLFYLLAHANQQAAEESFKKLREDPAWVKIKAASEREGSLTAPQDGITSLYLLATDYSPLQ